MIVVKINHRIYFKSVLLSKQCRNIINSVSYYHFSLLMITILIVGSSKFQRVISDHSTFEAPIMENKRFEVSSFGDLAFSSIDGPDHRSGPSHPSGPSYQSGPPTQLWNYILYLTLITK